MGNLLRSFIVNNASDRKVLDNIVKRHFPNLQPSIITKKFVNRLYDVSKGRVDPPEGTTLMLNEIKCSDNVVMNTLIDYKSMETILLVTKTDVAVKITMEQENVPRNLSKVFLIQPSLEYYPSPNYRIYPVNVGPSRLIQADPQVYIKQLQSELKDKDVQLKRLQVEQNNIVEQYQDVQGNIERVRSIIQNHIANKREIEEKIKELENIEYPTSNEIEILVSFLITKIAYINNHFLHRKRNVNH